MGGRAVNVARGSSIVLAVLLAGHGGMQGAAVICTPACPSLTRERGLPVLFQSLARVFLCLTNACRCPSRAACT